MTLVEALVRRSQLRFSQQSLASDRSSKNPLARHKRCDVYCGARETVGGSSVSSGCWGEDSNHEYGWARRTPTYVAPIRFSSQQLFKLTLQTESESNLHVRIDMFVL